MSPAGSATPEPRCGVTSGRSTRSSRRAGSPMPPRGSSASPTPPARSAVPSAPGCSTAASPASPKGEATSTRQRSRRRGHMTGCERPSPRRPSAPTSPSTVPSATTAGRRLPGSPSPTPPSRHRRCSPPCAGPAGRSSSRAPSCWTPLPPSTSWRGPRRRGASLRSTSCRGSWSPPWQPPRWTGSTTSGCSSPSSSRSVGSTSSVALVSSRTSVRWSSTSAPCRSGCPTSMLPSTT